MVQMQLLHVIYVVSARMSRLNNTIKFVFLVGETIFFIIAVGGLVFSSLILSGELKLLRSIQLVSSYSKVLLGASLVLICCICSGCVGAINQVKRKGIFSGRRILMCHNILLLGVFIMALKHEKDLSNRSNSIQVVQSNPSESRYDSFEWKVDAFFNDMYFSSLCGLDGDSIVENQQIISDYIDIICPEVMSSENCCSNVQCNGDECCPIDRERCKNQEFSFCPYDNCRFEILSLIQKYVQPGILGLKCISILSIIMLVLNCLLICFNPRDDIEIELLKTGVMTEDDLEQIKRLKRERKFTYDKGNIDLDVLHFDSSINAKDGLVRRDRKPRSRIHPDINSV